MAEFFLALVVFGHLYGFIYAVSVASMQAFSLFDILSSGGEDNSQYQGIRRILSQETRAVLLAAEAFRALLLAIVVLVVISWTPKWCAILGLSIGVCRIVALLVSWLLYLLAAEVMPKRAVGKEPGRKLAIVRVAVLVAIWWVLRPIVWAAERIAEWRSPERSPAERDEIVERAIDTLAESSGLDEPVIEPEERAMIQGVIGLEDTEVREVMIPRINVVAVDVHANIDDVRRRTAEHGHSRLPVFDGNLDSIVGVLYVKDLFCAESRGQVDLSTLVRKAFVVPETKKVSALLEEFKRTRTHVAIVVDEFGGTAGLVTLEDILEEIVGEIDDEHDRVRRHMEPVADGVLHADGVVPLVEIAEALGLDLSDERFETIGGLIYDRVGGVPIVGQSIREHGLEIVIEQMDGQRIRRVRVSRVPQLSDS